jgi:alpha-1,3-mannosyltransferase
MFNDCWTQLFLLAACWLFVKRQWTIGSVAYALALGVKMNALLYFPGIMVVLILASGLERAIRTVVLILEVHVLSSITVLTKVILAVPFTLQNAPSYVSKAFDFSRQFLWEWTVNWRWVGEDVFSSRTFAYVLLLGHLTTLLFFLVTRYIP